MERLPGATPRLQSCLFSPWPSGQGRGEHLKQTLTGLGIRRTLANAVLTSKDYQLLLVEAPDVQPAELRAAVRWRIKDLIDFHIDDAVIDVFDIPESARGGRSRTMYAVAARSPAVAACVDAAEATMLDLQVVDVPELALRNVASLAEADTRGAALLYLSHDAGLVTLTRQSTLYLARRLEINMDDVARAGMSREATAELAASIALEVQRSMDYYESHYDQAPIGDLLVTPHGQHCPGLYEHLSTELSVNVTELDLNDLLQCPQPLPSALQASCLLAVGAALREESVEL